MRRCARIVSLGLVIIAGVLPLCAQEPASDSTSVQMDTLPAESPHPIAKSQEQKAKSQWPYYADTAIFQGVTVRLDILNPILELARTAGHTYTVEAAVNVRLKNRFFPTMEFGYAGNFLQEKDAETPVYNGNGGYVKLGLDINPLKKHPEQRSALLIGVRAATGLEQLRRSVSNPELHGKWIADAWGEIVAGVQVNIVHGFNMGWAVRMKFLFTEKTHSDLTIPYYIPGYGNRNEMNWGFDYYLGFTF